MKESQPENVIQFKDAQALKNQKRRLIPEILGVSEAYLFGKRADRRTIAFFADAIKASWHEKKSPLVFYEECAKRGELGTLQKNLRQGDAYESTRGKLLIAYKAALAESDAYIGSVADAVDFSKPPSDDTDDFSKPPDLDRSDLGWIFWGVYGSL